MRWLWPVLLLCGPFVVPLLAAEGHEAAKEPSIIAPVLDLTIWTVVVFLVLLFVLRRFAWKPVLEGLQKREENIRFALDEAQKARADTQRMREQLQAEMNSASQKIRDMMDEARRDAERSTEQMTAKARTEIQAERERLRHEIAIARDQAVQELWNQTARLATSISSKAIRRSLTEDDHRRLVDEALAELRGAGNQSSHLG